MSFQLKIWDHCRYVKNRGKPYDEMARHLETMAGAGISASVIYMPEVISLDDYCRAAEQTGIAVEARISPAWGIREPVRRTLPEKDLQEMEKRFGIRLSGEENLHPFKLDVVFDGTSFRLVDDSSLRIFNVDRLLGLFLVL